MVGEGWDNALVNPGWGLFSTLGGVFEFCEEYPELFAEPPIWKEKDIQRDKLGNSSAVQSFGIYS